MNITEKLIAALQAVLPYAENEACSLHELVDNDIAEAEAKRALLAIENARAVIAEAYRRT